MNRKTQDFVDELNKLTVLELADLKSALEEAWGVTAAAPMMAAPGLAMPGGAEAMPVF